MRENHPVAGEAGQGFFIGETRSPHLNVLLQRADQELVLVFRPYLADIGGPEYIDFLI